MATEPNPATTGLPPENYMTEQEKVVAGGGDYAPPEETVEATAARLAKLDAEAAKSAKAEEEPVKNAKAKDEKKEERQEEKKR